MAGTREAFLAQDGRPSSWLRPLMARLPAGALALLSLTALLALLPRAASGLTMVTVSTEGWFATAPSATAGTAGRHSPQLQVVGPAPSSPPLEYTARPSVSTACGPMDGTWLLDGSVAAFRGIRYALPPVGSRRFMPPEAADCWEGRLDASLDGPACLQSDPSLVTDEDCLSLNVFAPAESVSDASKAALPVVVWIYGGSLVGGSASSYGPLEVLVRKAKEDGKPFVLLAMNYRLGALGWAALPELAAEDPRGVAGNYGLLDQILALRWAQDNIRAFGGDPERVSLFGQSSGGTSIFALLAAAPARGLFQRALSLSGSPRVTMDRVGKERQDAALWLPRTPCAGTTGTNLARCLRSANATALTNALPESYSAWGFDEDFPNISKGGLKWSALLYVDGVTVPSPVLDSLASGAARNVSVLFQSMQCEDGSEEIPFGEGDHLADATSYLVERLARYAGEDAAREVAERYTTLATRLSDANVSGDYAVTAFAADAAATCGTVALARAAARGGARGAYVGTVVQGTAGPLLSGGCSGQATRLPFHNFDFKAVLGWAASRGSGVWAPPYWCPYKATSADDALAGMLWGHWLSFLTTGRPLHTWHDVRDVHGGQQSEDVYAHAALGHPTGQTSVLPGWKSGACGDLEHRLHIGQSYWWIN